MESGQAQITKTISSRFFAKTCNCHYSALAISDIVIKAAQHASDALGVGHSESTYEHVIQNYLYDRRIPTRRQVKFFAQVCQDTVQTGILDLEVDRCVLIELKAGQSDINVDHKIQLRRYMNSAEKSYSSRPIIGMIILFSKSGDVKIWRSVITV